jgi:hypothetical protein
MARTRYTAEEIICHLQAVKLMSAMRQGMQDETYAQTLRP